MRVLLIELHLSGLYGVAQGRADWHSSPFRAFFLNEKIKNKKKKKKKKNQNKHVDGKQKGGRRSVPPVARAQQYAKSEEMEER